MIFRLLAGGRIMFLPSPALLLTGNLATSQHQLLVYSVWIPRS